MKLFYRSRFLATASLFALAVPFHAAVAAEAARVDDSAPVDEIVVTGTRLQTNGLTAPTPTSVISAQAIDAVAPIAIGEVLNRLPSVRLSAGPGQAQRFFSTGQSPIDLRGLGTLRTLTLVDGNRFTPTAENGTVDSSLIPVSLVQRVDVVTGGASAAYGSDAVAGVVNFILQKDLNGWRGNAQFGGTDKGDGREYTVSLGYGTPLFGGRGHFILGGDYSKSKGAGTIYTRDWGKREPYLVPNGLTRPAGTPAQSFRNDVHYSAQTIGGVITAGPLKGTAFAPGGQPYAFEYGQVFSTLMIGGVNERGNPNGNFPLMTPTSRRAVLGRVEYDLTDDIQFFAEGNYGYTDADSFTGFYQGSAVIGVNNPYLPAATRAEMTRLGLSTVNVGRLVADFGGVQLFTTHKTHRGIAGFSGKAFADFTWDASVQYGETQNYYYIKDVLVANFLAAVNAVPGPDGTPVCGPLGTNPNLNATRIAQVQPGCVPINIFGFGSPSKEALDYITGRGGSVRTTDLSRVVGAFNLRGAPFSTWAGPVNVAFGGEVRRDKLNSEVDAMQLQAAWNAANSGAFSGAVSVKEGYVEFGAPLARDEAWARTLDLNGAVRFTDYTTSGSVATWKIGATWEPVDGLRLRSTRSRDIRAPSLTDLFSYTGSGGLLNITNPFNGQSGRLSGSSTGNLNLKPEKADTTTVGFVVQPSWASWLSASVDYYDIRIKGAITTVGATDVLARCYAGEQTYCSAITFDNTAFGIANVATQPFNLNRLINRGLDLAVYFTFDMPNDMGRISIKSLTTKALAQKTFDRALIINRVGSLQSGGVPEWTGTVDTTYTRGPFTGTFTARYFSASKFDATQRGPEDAGYNPALGNTLNTNRFPGAMYLDLYADYAFNRTGDTPFSVFASVQNLADKDPAQFAATSIVSGGNPYDVIGRRFRVGVRFSH